MNAPRLKKKTNASPPARARRFARKPPIDFEARLAEPASLISLSSLQELQQDGAHFFRGASPQH
ncbi:hypothetical protein [Niveibacterium terrae]|uniref:hypothetical protein n=1 Tax=Niveibacterium terrae TaxID=3373598 RepID=UPI003A8DFC52